MFKTGALAASMAALLSTASFAAGPVITAGQYATTTQYTGLIDPDGVCAGITPVGAVTTGEATVKGLGLPLTQTINNPSPTSPYGVGYIQCTYAPLPAATAFKAATGGGYTASPTAATVTSCNASNGISYTLTSSNNASASPPTTNTITILPVLGTLSSFKQTATYSTVAIGGATICYLSTDTVLSRSGK